MNQRKGLSTGATILIVIVAVIVIFGGMIAGKYNGLVRAEESVNTQFSNISTQLQRRNDLIPNLVNTVKGYAKHEEGVFTAVTEARAKVMGAANGDELAAADGELSQALTRLIAVSEAYPELKASENFRDLQSQLEGTENGIAVARRDYNEVVKSYNTQIRSFPGNIIAGMFGFQKHELFQAAEGAEKVPSVNFE